jgi:hypothetical protein
MLSRGSAMRRRVRQLLGRRSSTVDRCTRSVVRPWSQTLGGRDRSVGRRVRIAGAAFALQEDACALRDEEIAAREQEIAPREGAIALSAGRFRSGSRRSHFRTVCRDRGESVLFLGHYVTALESASAPTADLAQRRPAAFNGRP